MPETKKCPHCGKKIKATATICLFCGHAVAAVKKPQQQSATPQGKPSRRSNITIFCQSCGREAPTKYVEYYENKGFLIRRYYREVKGHLCKDCTNKYFWPYTSTTLILGWWGTISFFVTLFILPNNIIRYLGTLGLEAPNPNSPPPVLTDSVIEKMKPFTDELFGRLNAGEELETIARSIAPRAGLSPGQVVKYVFAVAQALQQKKQ